MPAHPAYAATRAALADGLHGTHLAVEAWPAERPARGLRRRAIGSGIRPTQRQRGQTQAAAVMGRHGAPRPT
jgi:hypothetical protein